MTKGGRKYKKAYVLFFMLPLLYFVLRDNNSIVKHTGQQDYLYFTVRTNNPSVISLLADGDSLTSWEVNSAGYKYLDYSGKLEDKEGIVLQVKNLSANDTVSFSSFNLFRNDSVFSVYDNDTALRCVNNATICETGDALTAVVQKSGEPVDIALKKLSFWEKPVDQSRTKNLIWLSFLLVFILVVLMAPPVKHFLFSMAFVMMAMILFFWWLRDFNCGVSITTGSQQKNIQIFYKTDPCFIPGKMVASAAAGNSYNADIDLLNEDCIRYDMDGSTELKDVRYELSAGIFSEHWNLASVKPCRLLMNDLVLRNGNFIVTGDDPHFNFTAGYFVHHAREIVLLRQNLFLFASLLVFVLLICLHRLISRLYSNRFQSGYIYFLVIPLTYYMFAFVSTPAGDEGKKDAVYFSVYTGDSSVVSLEDAGKTLAAWNVSSAGYKYLEYTAGLVGTDAALSLRITNCSANDTIAVLSVNAFHDTKVVSLTKNENSLCGITNARTIGGNGFLDAVVQNPDAPVIITLPDFYKWQRSCPGKNTQICFILIFIILFLLVIVFAPDEKHFSSVCITTLLFMLAAFWMFYYVRFQVAIQTDCPVKSADFFYNSSPSFSAEKDVPQYEWKCFYKADIDLARNVFIRCDVDESSHSLDNFIVKIKGGYFSKEMELNKIPADKLLVNDINIKNGKFIITGNDPYFCLTSDYFINKIQYLVMMRKNFFFFITVLFFVASLLYIYFKGRKHSVAEDAQENIEQK